MAKCQARKSAGPDGLPYEVWKILPTELALEVNKIFDRCVRENTVPECWTISKGTPLYKKGDPADAYMYRIISLTDTLSKIYERVILARIMPVASTYLSTHQHGFRRGHNTEGAAFLLANAVGMGKTVHEARRHGMTYTAFVDIRKAYPTVHRPAMFSSNKQASAATCSAPLKLCITMYKVLCRSVARLAPHTLSKLECGKDLCCRQYCILFSSTTYSQNFMLQVKECASPVMQIAASPSWGTQMISCL